MTLAFKQLENRGELTKEISQYYLDKTKRVLTQNELRLIFQIMQQFHRGKKLGILNEVELNILESLRDERFISFGQIYQKINCYEIISYEINMKYEFYKICNELLYMSYVPKMEEEKREGIVEKELNFKILYEDLSLLKTIKDALQNNNVIKFVDNKFNQDLIKKNILFLSKLQEDSGLFIHNCKHSDYYFYYSKIGCSKEFWDEMNKVLFKI